MANNNAAVIPQVWAQEGLELLRENLVMGALVHRDFEDEIASEGDVVNYDIPVDYTVNSRSPSATTDYTLTDAKLDKGQIIVDKYRYISIVLSDADMAMSMGDLRSKHMPSMVKALANNIEGDLTNLFTLITNSTGTFNTTITEGAVRDGRENIWDGNANMDDPIYGVIHQHAENDLLSIARLTEEDKAPGFGQALENAFIGRRFGINWFVSQKVPKATNDISNCIFQRNAFALVQRRLGAVSGAAGVEQSEVTDNNYALRVSTGYNIEKGGVQVTMDILYGVKILRQALASELRN